MKADPEMDFIRDRHPEARIRSFALSGERGGLMAYEVGYYASKTSVQFIPITALYSDERVAVAAAIRELRKAEKTGVSDGKEDAG